jgi:hypothetical protein
MIYKITRFLHASDYEKDQYISAFPVSGSMSGICIFYTFVKITRFLIVQI